MTTTSQARTPAGVPTGGQFAASAHAESGVSLDKTNPLDGWLPPGAHQVVDCPDCRGAEPGVLTCRYCDIDGKVTTDRYGQVPFRPDVPGTKVAFEDPRDGEWQSATITATARDDLSEFYAVGLLADGTARDIYMRKTIPLHAAQAAARRGVNTSEMIEEAACEMNIGIDPSHDEVRAFLARIDDGYCEDIASSAKDYRRFRAAELREEGKTGPALDYSVDTSALDTAAIDRAIEAASDFKGQGYSSMTYVVAREHWYGHTIVATPSGRIATYGDTAWDEPEQAPMLPWSPPEGIPVAHVALDGTVRRVDLPGTPL